jgi:hypothetical protein
MALGVSRFGLLVVASGPEGSQIPLSPMRRHAQSGWPAWLAWGVRSTGRWRFASVSGLVTATALYDHVWGHGCMAATAHGVL